MHIFIKIGKFISINWSWLTMPFSPVSPAPVSTHTASLALSLSPHLSPVSLYNLIHNTWHARNEVRYGQQENCNAKKPSSFDLSLYLYRWHRHQQYRVIYAHLPIPAYHQNTKKNAQQLSIDRFWICVVLFFFFLRKCVKYFPIWLKSISPTWSNWTPMLYRLTHRMRFVSFKPMPFHLYVHLLLILCSMLCMCVCVCVLISGVMLIKSTLYGIIYYIPYSYFFSYLLRWALNTHAYFLSNHDVYYNTFKWQKKRKKNSSHNVRDSGKADRQAKDDGI